MERERERDWVSYGASEREGDGDLQEGAGKEGGRERGREGRGERE